MLPYLGRRFLSLGPLLLGMVALGFAIIGLMYGVAALTAAWPVAAPAKVLSESVVESVEG